MQGISMVAVLDIVPAETSNVNSVAAPQVNFQCDESQRLLDVGKAGIAP